MATTYGDLVSAALADLNVLAAGETAAAGDAALGLQVLNRLIDKWAGQGLTIPSLTRNTQTITANDETYTIGPTGNVVMTERPSKLFAVTLIDTAPSPDLEISLGDGLTDAGYAAISQKALTATRPSAWYYNPTVPNGVITLWPVPTGSNLQLGIYVREPLTQVSALTTNVSLAPGYQEFMVTQLALRLAPTFTRNQIPDELHEAARDAMATIKRNNKRLADLSFDLGAVGACTPAYDINTDSYR